jgi:hypothetical protein
MVERFFKLSENKTSVRTQALAGVTTLLTMAYIIFVQPAVLSGKMFGMVTPDQASSGSGPSESEGALGKRAARRSKACLGRLFHR